MAEKGMAYRKESFVNWCEVCQTVLANEQVEAGMCWRCGKPVRQKKLWQWFFKITDFAEDLLVHCDKLPDWPNKVTTMQRNWIGKSTGAEIRFEIEGSARFRMLIGSVFEEKLLDCRPHPTIRQTWAASNLATAGPCCTIWNSIRRRVTTF